MLHEWGGPLPPCRYLRHLLHAPLIGGDGVSGLQLLDYSNVLLSSTVNCVTGIIPCSKGSPANEKRTPVVVAVWWVLPWKRVLSCGCGVLRAMGGST